MGNQDDQAKTDAEPVAPSVRRQTAEIFWGNTTSFGPSVSTYVKGSKYTLAGYGETHKSKEKEINKERTDLALAGRRTWWNPARDTSEGGTTGGVMATCKHRVQADEVVAPGGPTDVGTRRPDVMAVALKLRGMVITVIFVYLTCGIGLAGEDNVQTLLAINEIIQYICTPWIILGDFNIPYEVLANSEWIKTWKGNVCVPTGGTITCRSTAKAGGSMIDLGVFSAGALALLIGFEIVHFVPWSPHYCILVKLNALPRTVRCWIPLLPIRLEPPTTTVTKQKGLKRRQREREQFRKEQEAAKAMAAEESTTAPPEDEVSEPFDEAHIFDFSDDEVKEAVTNKDDGEGEAKEADKDEQCKGPIMPTTHYTRKVLKIADDAMWDEEFRDAKTKLPLLQHGVTIGTIIDAQAEYELDINYWTWATASETTLVKHCKPDKPAKCTGRANPEIEYAWKCPFTKKEMESSQGVIKHKEANKWSCLAARLKDIVTLMERQNPEEDNIWKVVVQVARGIRDECKGDKIGNGTLNTKVVVQAVLTQAEAARRDGDVVKRIQTQVCAVATHYKKMAAKQVAKDIGKWKEEALANGAAGAHRYTKQSEIPKPLPLEAKADGRLYQGPQQMVDLRASCWTERWLRDQSMLTLTHETLAKCRDLALVSEMPPLITVGKIGEGLDSMKLAAGLGQDQWSIGQLRALPQNAKAEMAVMFNLWLKLLMFPSRLLHVWTGLLPKSPEPGGERPIGLVAMLIRLMGVIMKPVSAAWCAEMAGKWGTAVAGSSPIRAALLRAIKDEVAVNEKLAVMAFYADVAKFY